MNTSLVYAMLLPDAITVKVRFPYDYANNKVLDNNDQTRRYTYKALKSQNLSKGDFVLVMVAGRILKAAQVIEVDEFLDVNTTNDYSWVVQRVELATYDALVEKEKTVAKHLQLAKRENQRKELLAQLMLGYENENALRRELGLELIEVPAS